MKERTKCKHVDSLIVEHLIVFTDLREGCGYCIFELMVFGRVALLLPGSLKFFKCGYGMPEGWFMFMREDLLNIVCIRYNGLRVVDTFPVVWHETEGSPGYALVCTSWVSYRGNRAKELVC